MRAELKASLSICLNAVHEHEVSSRCSNCAVLIHVYVITSPMNVISVLVIVCVLHISWRHGVGHDRAGQTAGTWKLTQSEW